MNESKPNPNKIIEIDQGVIGPAKPRVRKVMEKKVGDYPSLPEAYLQVAKNYSSVLLMGPPICDELMDLILHMFDEEEARVLRHLKPLRSMTAADFARAEGRPLAEIQPVLDSMAEQKRLILSRGEEGKKKYYLLPIVPGAFEYALVRTSMDSLTEWHTRFAELFHQLYETGYMLDYAKYAEQPIVRYLPVGQTIQASQMALPSDKLEEVFSRYKTFGVGLCQCRMTEEIVGKGCGKPMGNCTAMGDVAEYGISTGTLQRRTLSEILEIKREAESHGLVTWMINEESGSAPTASCSCCGCCCHMLRSITEFNAPGWIAPPHFRPAFDDSKCTYCGKCARRCPMGALVVDMKAKTRQYLAERCVGCGQCVLACEKDKAVAMEPVKDYREPPSNLRSLLLKSTPGYIKTTWKVWRSR